ncbi:thioredoxin fold domain-containing protein [uncultured Winogradskyella sp.]|uniref:thioredoxin family protein n=1 Tax=uncultured Winogradskyella sp. TaxID=395353 RepID=UPI0026045E08|nr:thioredoxin fold domain-containing protein [uncultured Winogradskyella sp.]
MPALIFCQRANVNWLSFEELETALTEQPKKVVIHFYADWCLYCKKMEKAVYTKPEIIERLNADYYTVKFNVESTDTIRFGGKEFMNLNSGKKRMAFHQIPELLAGRENQELELPATVILDEEFNIIKRYYRYISPNEMKAVLK